MVPGPSKTVIAAGESRIASGDVKLEFDFEGVPVTIVSHEGKFKFTEQFSVPERGVLRTMVSRHFDFEINLYVAWVNDASFYEKIKDAKKFDLTVTIDDQRYVLKDVLLDKCIYVPGSTEFSLSGIVNNVGT